MQQFDIVDVDRVPVFSYQEIMAQSFHPCRKLCCILYIYLPVPGMYAQARKNEGAGTILSLLFNFFIPLHYFLTFKKRLGRL